MPHLIGLPSLWPEIAVKITAKKCGLKIHDSFSLQLRSHMADALT
jgi:hypothetical protein